MADALSFLEEDLSCLICCDIFTDPVTLKCSHSLCEKCLERFWKYQVVLQCPVCRKECTPDEPNKSLAFRALCESFKMRKPTAVSGDVCPQHKETLKLFCFEDKQPICVICYTSKNHENHKCSPVEEAAGDLKADFKMQMDRMQVTLDDLKKTHKTCVEQAKKITEQEEIQIKEEFEKLHQFLRDEEDKWIKALKKNIKPQDGKLKATIKDLSTQITELSERMAALWQDIKAENIVFLQNYSDTLQKLKYQSVKQRPAEAEKYQHHSPQTMIFTTWARMQNLVEQPPVTLDPNTASSRQRVSEGCIRLQYVQKKLDMSDNPKRLFLGVLASEGFDSGIHCWDVEVRNNNHWTLGVVGETVNRKRLYIMDPKSHFWGFRFVDGRFKKANNPGKEIYENVRPNIIRVQLDFEKGELKFIDPFRNKNLCTFTGGFPERVFPYFCTGDLATPLNIFPANKEK